MTKNQKSVVVTSAELNGFMRYYTPSNSEEGFYSMEKTGKKIKQGGLWLEEYETIRKLPDFLQCSCGYEGIPAIEKEECFYNYHVPVKKVRTDKGYFYETLLNPQFFDITERVLVKPTYQCPSCKKRSDVVMSYLTDQSVKIVDSCQIIRNEENSTLSFQWITGEYQWDSVKKEIQTTQVRGQFEVNLISGETTFSESVNPEKKWDLSFGITEGGGYLFWELIEVLSSSREGVHLFFVFLQEALNQRGVTFHTAFNLAAGNLFRRDSINKELPQKMLTKEQVIDYILQKTPEDPLEDKKGQRYVEMIFNQGSIMQVFPFLRHPSFAYSPWRDLTCLPKEIQMELADRSSFTFSDLLEVLTDHRSKTVRKIVHQRTNFETALIYGKFLRNPNHLKKLFIEEKDDPSSDFFNPTTVLQSMRYGVLTTGLFLLQEFHREDEKGFVDALLRLSRKLRRGAVGLQRRFNQVENVFYQKEVNRIIIDIAKQYVEIKEEYPDFHFEYDGDIMRFHDSVSREYRRLKQRNLPIPYEKREKERFERVVDGYSFTLAKDTEELVKVGNELDICVGGYREQALKRHSTIVFVRDPNGIFSVCLEVLFGDPEDEGYLEQAKIAGNELPDEKEASVVKKWCDLCSIDTSESPDLEILLKEEELKSSIQ